MQKIVTLDQALQYARDFQNFSAVHQAVTFHPEWLTYIPEDRRWSILHQIVFSGETKNLNLILATQLKNEDFRLLFKGRDGLTVLDVANSLTTSNGEEMRKRINRFIEFDQLLDCAAQSQWEQCIALVTAKPLLGYEKPPYRRFYLINYIAQSDDIQLFERFLAIPNFHFDLTVLVGGKKINEFARQQRAEKFAKYLEKKYPDEFTRETSLNQVFRVTAAMATRTKDFMDLMNIAVSMPETLDPKAKSTSGPNTTSRCRRVPPETERKLEEMRTNVSVQEMIQACPMAIIKQLLVCSLTGQLLHDPVVAPDGFTYERAAIEQHFAKTDRSPSTNEVLPRKDLQPNIVVKEMLKIFSLGSS